MREGITAIFTGADLSRAPGYVDRNTLISPLAAELGLDMKRDTDYQFFRCIRSALSVTGNLHIIRVLDIRGSNAHIAKKRYNYE